jgi:hypothetical protein
LAEKTGKRQLTAKNTKDTKMKLQRFVVALYLAALTASAAGEPTNVILSARYSIDSETVSNWSAPFRNWHYWPDHVIPATPPLPGATNILGTDIPTVFQIPGDDKWYMSFVAFDGAGYQSYTNLQSIGY